jgi:hypothetical protein
VAHSSLLSLREHRHLLATEEELLLPSSEDYLFNKMAPSKATASHLSLLADTTLTSLYERERLLRLGTQHTAADDAEIRHSLNTLKLGISQLEKELEGLEQNGATSQEIKQKEDVVIKLQSQVSSPISLIDKYDRLRRMMDGEEEEEIRPKRGKSIRLPEDTDLEAQR